MMSPPSWRWFSFLVLGSLFSAISYGSTIFALYTAGGDSRSTSQTSLFAGTDNETPATNQNGASYDNFYTVQVIDPSSGLTITSTLAKSDVYSRPGAMGILSYVASPAIGSALTPAATFGQAIIREGVMADNQQLDGSITIQYSLHGNQTLNLGSGSGDYGEFLIGIVNTESGASLYNESYLTNSGGNQFHETGLASGTVTFPIVNGIADMGLLLNVSALCGGTCQAAADFYGTLNLGAANVFDSHGNLEPGVKIISASGFDYNAPLPTEAAVPEPGSFIMLPIGLAAAILVKGRWRQFGCIKQL